jgi:NosR/NirI family nitrous oxide reductase transcriptional regulator
VAPVLKQGNQIGFVFLTSDFVSTTGYSGKPIHQLVAVSKEGVIQKVLLVEHHEPIVLVGIPEKRIVAVLKEYIGLDVGKLARGEQDHKLDVVSGATVTVMVMDDTILHSAIKVAHAHGLAGLEPEHEQTGPVAEVNPNISQVKSWADLVSEGSVAHLKINLKQINKAFADQGNPLALKFPEKGPDNETFVELYAAVVSVPSIGRSLLGENEYRNLEHKLKPGEQAILLAGDGRFSFKGSGYVRGGIFDRFQVIQGDRSIRFHDRYHKRLNRIERRSSAERCRFIQNPGGFKIQCSSALEVKITGGTQYWSNKESIFNF